MKNVNNQLYKSDDVPTLLVGLNFKRIPKS